MDPSPAQLSMDAGMRAVRQHMLQRNVGEELECLQRKPAAEGRNTCISTLLWGRNMPVRSLA